MPDTPFTVERFGGLNLRDDPEEIGAAATIAVLDCDISNLGVVGPRPGWQIQIDGTAFTGVRPSISFLYALPFSNMVLTSDQGVHVRTWDATGTQIASHAGLAFSAADIATESQAAGTYVGDAGATYFVDSSGAITLPTFTGHTPAGGLLAAWDSRLVCNDGNDRLIFSDRGDPLTFTYSGSGSTATGNWIDLDPHDGQTIQAMVTFRDYLLVFKRTKMFVVYSTSLQDDGSPVFNFRSVRNMPAAEFGAKSIAVGRDAVYYMNRGGIWATTGDVPAKVSDVIAPLFPAIPTQISAGNTVKVGATTGAAPVVHWSHDRLYVAYPSAASSTGNDRILVWDQNRNAWTLWSADTSIATSSSGGVASMCTQPIGSSSSTTDTLLAGTQYVDLVGVNDAGALVKSLTDTTTYSDRWKETTSGTVHTNPIAWSYQSGKYPLSDPARIAVTRESKMVGTGTVNLRIDTDLFSNINGTVTLGTAPTPAEGWLQADQEGELFQHTLSGTGQGQVNRLTHYISFVRGTDEGN